MNKRIADYLRKLAQSTADELGDAPGYTPPSSPSTVKIPEQVIPAGSSRVAYNSLGDAPGYTPTGSSSTVKLPEQVIPVGSSGGGYSQGYATIREMQQAILDFAAKAEATSSTNLQGAGQEEGAQTRETDNPNYDPSQPEGPNNQKTFTSNEHLGGTDPFGRFLVSNYLNSASPVGKQYLNVDVAGQKNRNDASIKNTSLKGIIDTIKRIGSPGMTGEKAKDGQWGTRTNNALKAIYAVSYAVYNASKTMGLNIDVLNDSVLTKFQSLIPVDDASLAKLSANEKVARAKELAPLIDTMSSVFDEFKKYVLSNTKYTKYLEQNKSFQQYKQLPTSGSSLLSKEENEVYRANMSEPLAGLEIGNTSVNLADLENMQYFKMMMQRAGRNPNDPNQVNQTLAEVSKALGGKDIAIPNSDPGY